MSEEKKEPLEGLSKNAKKAVLAVLQAYEKSLAGLSGSEAQQVLSALIDTFIQQDIECASALALGKIGKVKP